MDQLQKRNRSKRKTRSNKQRAGDNNPVCNTSLSNGWTRRKAQTFIRWAGKPSEGPQRPRCSAASRDGPPHTSGDAKERSRDICNQSQQLLQHTRWWKSHHHHAHTATVATPFLSGAEKGIRNTLKLNSYCVMHTHTYMCMSLAWGCDWFNGHVWSE